MLSFMENDTLFFWIIFGVALWVAYAWDRTKKLRFESEEQSRQINDLKNQVAALKTELEEKKVISWEKDKFVKDLDKHIEEITQ